MLSIDEEIAQEREIAKEQKTKYDNCLTRMRYCCEMCFHNPKCNEVAEHHEQLAEWLEDYKRIKMLIPIEQELKAEYNKAIDDCLLVINENREKFIADICYSDLYDSIVQLKAGGAK